MAFYLASCTLQGDACTRSLQGVPGTPSGLETGARFAQLVPRAAVGRSLAINTPLNRASSVTQPNRVKP